MKRFQYILISAMLLFILPAASAILPAAFAECIIPAENLEVKGNILFCAGEFNIESGIKINSNNVIIQCNETSLTGNGIGYGFLLKDKSGIVVRNCNISNYEIGIYLENTNDSIINNNSLTKNKFGISLLNSYNNNVGNNSMSDNVKDYLTNNTVLEKIEELKPFVIEKKNAENQQDLNNTPKTEIKRANDGSEKKANKIDYLLIALIVIVIVFASYFVYNWIFYRKN